MSSAEGQPASRAKRAMLMLALMSSAFLGAYWLSPDGGLQRDAEEPPVSQSRPVEEAEVRSVAPVEEPGDLQEEYRAETGTVDGGETPAAAATPPPPGSIGAVAAAADAGRMPPGCWRTCTTHFFTTGVEDGVQKTTVDMTSNLILYVWLDAGIPAELTFSKGADSRMSVHSDDLGFTEDVSGGPAVVTLPALKAGSYQLESDDDAYIGAIVVR